MKVRQPSMFGLRIFGVVRSFLIALPIEAEFIDYEKKDGNNCADTERQSG